MIVYHRTKSKKSAIAILNRGFKKNKGFYGVGVYTCRDLESATSSYSKRHYGNALIECDFVADCEIKCFSSSEEALKFNKDHKGHSFDLCYTNKNDGNVIFVGNTNKVKPIRFSLNDGQTWRKF
jgi:hypothetical protein